MLLAAALSLLASAPTQNPPPLLPRTPEGWRYERIDFPLSFAPEIDLEGYEELRFAPGMFDAGADSYFSYILGLRLEGHVDVDRAFLQGLLEPYYRGLCRSVAEGRGEEIDLSGFAVQVAEVDAGYTATVHMVDVFVTGQPLRLTLELSVHPGPRATEILGLASPQPKDATIWKELHGLGEAWRAIRPMPVFLNHLYVVPDAETYAALTGSAFLRETFGVCEERTTVRRDMSYTGFYVYGKRTYFEFLRPDESTGRFAPGDSGLAFGVEVEGGTDLMTKALGERNIAAFAASITRATDGEQVPWFRMLGLEAAHERSRLSLFSLEYDPRFLESWHADLAPAGTGIARRAVLERYAAKLGQRRDERLLRDVTAVELALDEPERKRLLESCRAFGYAVAQQQDAWVCAGSGVRFIVHASPGPGRITRFEMSLRRPLELEPLELGKATLRFDGDRASFVFPR